MPHTQPVEYFTFTHPKRSSDFCIRAAAPKTDGVTPTVFGVADMIGHPTGLRWRNYMHVFERQMSRALRAAPPRNPEELHRIVLDQLAWQSAQIHRFRSAHDRGAFGFCVCMAEAFGRLVRVAWLGDCRAYLLRRHGNGPDAPASFEVRCLTEDHNELTPLLRAEEETVLFKHELVERSKRLSRFLGIEDDAAVRETLEQSHTDLELGPGECLILLTDGIYMPHVRQLVEGANDRFTADRYRLESWLAGTLEKADARIPDGEANYWQELVTILLEMTLDHTKRNRRRRDDMALTGLYLMPGR